MPVMQSSSMLLVEQDMSYVKVDIDEDMDNNLSSPIKSLNISR